jgi:hypothetical protein
VTPALLSDLPLIVLSRGRDASPELHAAHARIARMSRNARHLVVADAYHEIHLSHPEGGDRLGARCRRRLSAPVRR